MTPSFPRISYGILSRKSVARILILGPYKPARARNGLRKLRDCLRVSGYSQASLLEDLPFRAQLPGESPEIYFWEKSKAYTANWVEIALYVLICQANNLGVLSEFDYMQYNVKPLLRTSTVFIDENCQFPSLTTKGNINFSGINQRMFKTDRGLCKAAKAECLIHLRTLI